MTAPNKPLGSQRKRLGSSQRLAGLDILADETIEKAVESFLKRSGAPRIITRFHPEAEWLWRQWQGTVFESTWKPAASMMLITACFVLFMAISDEVSWALLAVPDPAHYVVQKLRAVENLWSYLLPMATFVNTFFLSQAYGFW